MKISVATKIGLSLSLLVVLAVGTSVSAYTSLQTIKEADRWDIHTMDVLNAAQEMLAGMVNQETGVRGYLVSGDENFLEPYHAGKVQLKEALDHLLVKTSDNPNATAQLQEIGAAAARWTTEIADHEIAMMGNPATVEKARQSEASGAGKGLMDAFRARLQDFVDAESALLSERRQAKVDAGAFGVSVIIGGGIVLLCASLMIGVWLTRNIALVSAQLTNVLRRVADGEAELHVPHAERSDELGDMARAIHQITTATTGQTAAARQIADGDMSVRIAVRSEHDVLGKSLNAMIERLRHAIAQASSAALSVEKSAQDISLAADQINEGTTNQASAAQQVSAAMVEISSNIRQGMENALETEKIAIKAADRATEGGTAVNEAVTAMQEIARKIDIVHEIARQTDLLALNAAVEAARAGDHGKGFAVVASEVRKLAERSQSAATEINEIARQTMSSSNKAVEILNDMVPSIQETSQLVQEISAALREQDTGANQIHEAIVSLDKGIHGNLSAAEHSTSIAAGLTESSRDLTAGMSFFSLGASAKLAMTPAPLANAA